MRTFYYASAFFFFSYVVGSYIMFGVVCWLWFINMLRVLLVSFSLVASLRGVLPVKVVRG